MIRNPLIPADRLSIENNFQPKLDGGNNGKNIRYYNLWGGFWLFRWQGKFILQIDTFREYITDRFQPCLINRVADCGCLAAVVRRICRSSVVFQADIRCQDVRLTATVGGCGTTLSQGLRSGSVRHRAAERHRAVLWLAVSSGIASQIEILRYSSGIQTQPTQLPGDRLVVLFLVMSEHR